jgi:hypothetical protein
MSKKEIKVQIVDDLYNRDEILSMKFTEININRWLRLGDSEELEFFAKIGLINNSHFCLDCGEKCN